MRFKIKRPKPNRTASMRPEVRAALRKQMRDFQKKFGRDPGPGDPVLFDPDANEPRPIELDDYESRMTEAMSTAGIDPAIIYAFRRTGLLVTEENWTRLSTEDQQAWGDALEEYRAQTEDRRPS